jgi:hypothetical protein
VTVWSWRFESSSGHHFLVRQCAAMLEKPQRICEVSSCVERYRSLQAVEEVSCFASRMASSPFCQSRFRSTPRHRSACRRQRSDPGKEAASFWLHQNRCREFGRNVAFQQPVAVLGNSRAIPGRIVDADPYEPGPPSDRERIFQRPARSEHRTKDCLEGNHRPANGITERVVVQASLHVQRRDWRSPLRSRDAL